MSDPNKHVWKSYVWHEDKCFFVSTIKRTYETYDGESRDFETLVREYDYAARELGRIVYQASGLTDHNEICRSVIATGEMPKEEQDGL